MPSDPLAEFLVAHAQAIMRLHKRGEGERLGLTPAVLGAALYRSVCGRDIAKASTATIDAYLDGLHARDLVLAAACAQGDDRAWETLREAYWPAVEAAARLLDRDETSAQDLADSMWSELKLADGRVDETRTLLGSYGGRSPLGTWLNAVLANRFADAVRTDKPASDGNAESDGEAPDPDRSWYVDALGAALNEALAALDPRDRLRLAYYYLENLTLRDISRLLNEHPSRVSRKLRQTRDDLRSSVEESLRRERNLSEEQIRLCYQYATERWPFDLRRAVSDANE
jgi:RNA polymerase sigma-70 factor